jgi:hypothetical protein
MMLGLSNLNNQLRSKLSSAFDSIKFFRKFDTNKIAVLNNFNQLLSQKVNRRYYKTFASLCIRKKAYKKLVLRLLLNISKVKHLFMKKYYYHKWNNKVKDDIHVY